MPQRFPERPYEGGALDLIQRSSYLNDTLAALHRDLPEILLGAASDTRFDVVTVRNDSGTAAVRGSVLGLDKVLLAAGSTVAPEKAWSGPPRFTAVAPVEASLDRLAIARAPIKAGAIGQCYAGGWVQCLCDYNTAGDTQAEIASGTNKLSSFTATPGKTGIPIIAADPAATGTDKLVMARLVGASASAPPASDVTTVFTAVPAATIAGAPGFGAGNAMGMGSGTIWRNTIATGPVRVVPVALSGSKDIANPFATPLPGPTVGAREAHYPCVLVSESPEVYQVVGPDFARMLYNYTGAARKRTFVLPDAAGTSSEAYQWLATDCD